VAKNSAPINADEWIARCWRRLRFGQFLKNAADALTIYLFLFGTTVLVVKLAAPQFWPHVLWMGLGAVPVAGAAWWFSGKEKFSRSESVAILDQRMNAGGLLMTLAESPHEQWQESLPQFNSIWKDCLPQLWPMRFLRHIVLPAVFVGGVFLIPVRQIQAKQKGTPNITAQEATGQLQELLSNLSDGSVLDEAEQQQLKDEIEKLIKETKNAPLTHEKWETVDALRDRMRMRVDTAAATVGKASDALAQLAKALKSDGSQVLPESVERLQKDVAEGLKKLAKAGNFKRLSPELREQLERLMKDENFEIPDELLDEELMQELQDFLDEEADRLAEMRQGQGDGELQGGNIRRGPGGLGQGGGPSDLEWGDESDKDGSKFKETILPPGALDDPSNEVVGISLTRPNDAPSEFAPRGAARNTKAASGDEVNSRNIRPRHRSVIRRYFDKEKSNSNDPANE
jgi:hypothetical protein